MEEEPSLDPKLQKIVHMAPLENMEEELQFGHPSNSIEGFIVNGKFSVLRPNVLSFELFC
jgi:hypothetical protein